jgi:hypothetical protein
MTTTQTVRDGRLADAGRGAPIPAAGHVRLAEQVDREWFRHGIALVAGSPMAAGLSQPPSHPCGARYRRFGNRPRRPA